MLTFMVKVQKPYGRYAKASNYRMTLVVPAESSGHACELTDFWLSANNRADHRILEVRKIDAPTVIKA